MLYFYGGTPMTNTTYVAYSDEVEEQRPDEDELINTHRQGAASRQRAGLQEV